MKKRFFGILCVVFSFTAFAHSTVHDRPATKMKFAPAYLRLSDNIPTLNLKVVPGSIDGFTNYPQEKQNMVAAFNLVEKVINSEEFKQRVINYLDQSGNRNYTNNRGMTSEQVYEFIMNGKELIDGDSTLGEMNFDVSRYYKGWSKVIGYSNMGSDNIIHVNGKFYAGYTPEEITGNITHEWLHIMGFTHSSASDHDSVPYAVGYIMDDLAKKFVKQGYLN